MKPRTTVKATFQSFTKIFGIPEKDYLSYNSKRPRTDHFVLIWVRQKRAKSVCFKYRGHKYKPRTKTEPFKPKLLTFECYVLRKMR